MASENLNLPAEPRFLITRLSAIGDCIHTVPVAHAIRDRYPRAYIAWCTQGGPATLIESDVVDQVIVVRRDWLKSIKSILQIRRTLRDLKIDVAIDPQSLTKSSALGWLSGAKHRIGFAKPQGRELSLWWNNHKIAPQTEHVVDRYLELLKPVGIDRPSVRFDMPRCVASDQSVDAFLIQNSLSSKFAVINPGAGWESKIWPAERFAHVASFLGTQLQLPSVVVWADKPEREMAEAIVAGSGGHAMLAPRTSLTELRSFVQRAKLFVGSDTGPMHLAVAVDTPCVAIFGPTSPLRCGPYGEAHSALHRPVASNQSLRSDDNRAMLAVSVEDVTTACKIILDNISRRVA